MSRGTLWNPCPSRRYRFYWHGKNTERLLRTETEKVKYEQQATSFSDITVIEHSSPDQEDHQAWVPQKVLDETLLILTFKLDFVFYLYNEMHKSQMF